MKNITAVKLRLILIVSILLLAVGGVAVFLFGYHKIQDYAVISQNTAAQAAASNSSLQDLVTTKKILEDKATIVDKAAQLASESKSYVYQDQIINDINAFAAKAGITITNISFANTTTANPAGTSQPATTPADGAVGPSAAAIAAPTGIKSVAATVTLKTPIPYFNMLTFIHLIEQSLFRMQISQVSLSHTTDENSGASDVNSDALTIEVYIR